MKLPFRSRSVSPNTYRPRALSWPIHQAQGFELLTGGFLQTAVSNAPRTTSRT